MHELNVQKFLRNGGTIDQLKSDLGIKCNQDNRVKDSKVSDLILLSYSQIDSPKSNQIVMECRGLVLEKGTWDIKSYPFKRFFNYGEMETQSFDFSNCYVLEKIDGSLITFFYYENQWHLTTRGTINGTGNVGSGNITFGELINKMIKNKYPNFYDQLNKDINYTFEFVSPENKVITPYDYRDLYLIGMRNIFSYTECDYDSLVNESTRLGVRVPKRYHGSEYNAIVKLTSDMEATNEGFVCVNYNGYYDGMNFSRVKVKNPSYVALAHLKENGGRSVCAIMECLMRGEDREFLSYFPEYSNYFSTIGEVYKKYSNDVESSIILARKKIEELKDDPQSKKLFAMFAKETVAPSIMFLLYSGQINSFHDWINLNSEKFGTKFVAKKLCEILHVKDINFYEET